MEGVELSGNEGQDLSSRRPAPSLHQAREALPEFESPSNKPSSGIIMHLGGPVLLRTGGLPSPRLSRTASTEHRVQGQSDGGGSTHPGDIGQLWLPGVHSTRQKSSSLRWPFPAVFLTQAYNSQHPCTVSFPPGHFFRPPRLLGS